MITKGVTEVYCIENYSVEYRYTFHKGQYYKVRVHESKYSDIRIFDNFDNALEFYLTSDFNTYFVKDHFLTKQELRKAKLKKISNVNKRYN